MSAPATSPGLALWLDCSQVAYSDAGTTVATSPYGRIAQIAQPAPLSGDWTAIGDARPWREPSSLDFHYRDTPLLTAPAPAAPIIANNCTISLAWQSRGGQLPISLFAATISTGSIIGVQVAASALYIMCPGIGDGSLQAIPGLPGLGVLIAQCSLIITCSPTQFEFRLTVDGTLYTSTVVSAPPSGTLGPFKIGRWNGNEPNAHFALSQCVVTSQALNSTEQGDLRTYLRSKPADEPPTTAPLVAMLGDSIGASWFPGYQTLLNGLSNPPRVISAAVAGAGTTNPLSIPKYYVDAIRPRYSAARSKQYVVCQGISVNDLILVYSLGSAVTASTVLAAYYDLLSTIRSDGFGTIACTLSPNLGGTLYDEARAIINADIRANWQSHADYLADLGAAPGMSTTADAANAFYFYDGTHVTRNGYYVWDSVLAPVLQTALLAVSNPPAAASAGSGGHGSLSFPRASVIVVERGSSR